MGSESVPAAKEATLLPFIDVAANSPASVIAKNRLTAITSSSFFLNKLLNYFFTF
jgi:hypothetical protein